jgi:hypothetical protein
MSEQPPQGPLPLEVDTQPRPDDGPQYVDQDPQPYPGSPV